MFSWDTSNTDHNTDSYTTLANESVALSSRELNYSSLPHLEDMMTMSRTTRCWERWWMLRHLRLHVSARNNECSHRLTLLPRLCLCVRVCVRWCPVVNLGDWNNDLHPPLLHDSLSYCRITGHCTQSVRYLHHWSSTGSYLFCQQMSLYSNSRLINWFIWHLVADIPYSINEGKWQVKVKIIFCTANMATNGLGSTSLIPQLYIFSLK